jgi:hypothetical protein
LAFQRALNHDKYQRHFNLAFGCALCNHGKMNRIRLTATRLAALFSSIIIGLSIARGAEIDLYVMAGQSNMYGHSGDARMYPPDADGLDQKILFYANGWTTMRPQSGQFPSGHFGPEVSFSRELARLGGNVAVFKYSQGSTSIANNWLTPNAGGMYDSMMESLITAMNELENDGHQPTIRALVWIQGESDAHTVEMANAYQSRLSLIIDHFRAFVGNDFLPIILGVDEHHPWVKINPQVVTAQQSIAEKEGITFTSMIGLPKADLSHLTPRGLVTHGKRLFTALTGVEPSPDNEYLGFPQASAKKDGRMTRRERERLKRQRLRILKNRNHHRR